MGGIDLEQKGATTRRGTQEMRLGETLIVHGPSSEPIAPDMLLLRGCVLRNTRWVVGLVLNTGPDTKIMMSMSKVEHWLCKNVQERRYVGGTKRPVRLHKHFSAWGGGGLFVCRTY